MFEKLKLLANGEKFQIICTIIICGLLLFMYSCESKAMSLQDPTRKVTRAELLAEFEFITAQMNIRTADLDRQDAFKQMMTDQAVLISSGGQINPAGLITTVAAIFGFGAVIDNVRKRKVINNGLNKVVSDAKIKTDKC